MARIKIDIPDTFSFSVDFAVRITDLNYGSHVGNDKVLAYLHEARVAFLKTLGYSELDVDGVGLIMSDAAIIFKNEMYYGDELLVSIQPVEFTRVGFDLIYKIEKKLSGQLQIVALGKTAMVCYDYSLKKVVALPDSAKKKLGL